MAQPDFSGFLDLHERLAGDEKGEAQYFLDGLFRAFGHQGAIQAGAVPEARSRRKGGRRAFLDLHWPKRVLVEMKKRGERLERHYDQAFDYWTHIVPDRPPYVVLCNFDELWVYDFRIQLFEPVDRVSVEDLPSRWRALAFLDTADTRPIFRHNLEEVTREAAADVASLFNGLLSRGEGSAEAQRFALQSVVAMFSEDVGLLPTGLFTELLEDCQRGSASTYDLLGSLFQQMATETPARGGRFTGVPYFNGGIFKDAARMELTPPETERLLAAARRDWSMVNPAIFGTLFQQSLEAAERHALGAHFTSEADIQKVIRPTIVAPLRKRLDAAKTLKEYQALRRDIVSFRVLDPACGSGNFLYVAYRELKRLERELLAQVEEEFSEGTASKMKGVGVRLTNFFGIDIEPRAVAVARTTMALARELALLEDYGDVTQAALSFEPPLPLENIDDNILVADALFTDWPNADAIVGNPPFLDARKLTMEHGKDYANRVRAAYPDVPGRADFCVYWFRKTHDTLRPGHRAGLVGTNSIRQNYSREGGLDYVLANGGTITEAVSTQDWSGDAAVHVSIVNWVKGAAEGPHILHSQDTESTDKAWSRREVSRIGASLAYGVELSEAKAIPSNIKPKVCFEGQQPGHKGFVLSRAERSAIITADPKSADIIYPYVNGSQILTGKYTHAPRWVIDYGAVGRLDAAKQHGAFAHLEQRVLPDWQAKADAERQKTGRGTGEHQRRLEQWWILKRRRADMLDALDGKHRYLACVRVSKRAIFFFIDAGTRPDSALSVFALDDDYSFGVLHSDLFRAWSVRKGSSLKGDPRFTPDTGFRTYPWPQSPSTKSVNAVAEAARYLREVRAKHLPAFNGSLRDLYQANEGPGRSSLKDAQREIDGKVRQAYGLKKKASVDSALAELLELNGQLVTREQDGDPVQGPGVPLGIADSKVRSDDAISPPSA